MSQVSGSHGFVSALRVVSHMVVFGDATVERLLRRVRPDVHCKGTDYTVDTVAERAVVNAYGGRTAIVGDTPPAISWLESRT